MSESGVPEVHVAATEAQRIAEEDIRHRLALKEAAAKVEALERKASPSELRIIELLEGIAFSADEQGRTLRAIHDEIATMRRELQERRR